MGLFRDKKEEYSKWMRLDPSVRFRMLVEDRAEIYKNEFLEDEKFIDNLYAQKVKHEITQQSLVKSVIYLLALLFLLVNGGDLDLPVFKVKISEIPSFLEISLFLLSLSLVFTAMKIVDMLALDAIIDGVLKTKYGDDRLKTHMIKSSKYPESSFWILFQKSYLMNFVERLAPGKRAGALNRVFLALMILILISMMLIPVSYVLYVAVVVVPKSLIGISISCFSVLCTIFALITVGMSFFNVPYDITEYQSE